MGQSKQKKGIRAKMINQERKQRHIDQLRQIGFTGSYKTLRSIENLMHYYAERWCNGDIDTLTYEIKEKSVTDALARLFKDGKLPNGFFVNNDPRGYALKIESEVNTLAQHDWGGYGILAPDPDSF